ncbi:hypothetical protein BDQ12DRAFT_659509, partial [Crucibulum laeve]
MFNNQEMITISTHLVLDDSFDPDSDIARFLKIKFYEIQQKHPLSRHIPNSWPSKEDINILIRKSSGQFIYASTVIKYVASPRHRPPDRLKIILGITSAHDETPFVDLDSLYKYILSSASDYGRVADIISIALFGYDSEDYYFDRSSTSFMERLLGLRAGDVHLALDDLYSLIDILPDNHPTFPCRIRIHHASIADFVLDRSRSNQYFIDQARAQAKLAHCCIVHIKTDAYQDFHYPILYLSYHLSGAFPTEELKESLIHFNPAEWMKARSKIRNFGAHTHMNRTWDELMHILVYHKIYTMELSQHSESLKRWDAYMRSELDNYATKFPLDDLICWITLIILPIKMSPRQRDILLNSIFDDTYNVKFDQDDIFGFLSSFPVGQTQIQP